jgi:hypothetical protein
MALHLRRANFQTANANPAADIASPPVMKVSAGTRVDIVVPVNARAKPKKITKMPWRDFRDPDSRLPKLAAIRTAIETTATKSNSGTNIMLSVVPITQVAPEMLALASPKSK